MAILLKEGDYWIVGGSKHRGKKLEEVAKEDPSYLKWMFGYEVSKSLSTDAFNYLSDVLEKYNIDPHQKDKKPESTDKCTRG